MSKLSMPFLSPRPSPRPRFGTPVTSVRPTSSTWPIVTAGGVAITIAATLVPGAHTVLCYDRMAVRLGGFGRIATASWTHASPAALAVNVAAFLALGIACERRGRAALAWTIGIASVAVTLAIHAFGASIDRFGGLDGVIAAMIGLAVVHLAYDARRRVRRASITLALIVAATLIVKLLETTTPTVPLAACTWGVGVGAGAFVGWRFRLAEARGELTPTSRPSAGRGRSTGRRRPARR